MLWLETWLVNWQTKLNRQLLNFKDTPIDRGVDFNFTASEKLTISQKVREYIESSFSGRSVASIALAGKETSIVDLDICFWVNGEMRASVVLAERFTLSKALELCTRRALHDGRFRKIEESELRDLQIEITFFGGEWKPVSMKELRANSIDPERGLVAMLDGRVVAWYIPAVHNVLAFRNLRDMIGSLLNKKGKLSSAEAENARIFTFSTDGWIENAQRGIIGLRGPVPGAPGADQSVESLFETSLQWLLRQEMSPGMFRPKCEAEIDATRDMNWPRLAFTAWVLAEVGKSLNREDCTEAWERIDSYLKKGLADALFIQSQEKVLTALYAGRAAFAASMNSNLAREWLLISERYCRIESLDPIGKLQGAMLLAELGGEDLKRAQSILTSAYQEWIRVRRSVQLALYPEIIALGVKLFQKTQNSFFRDQAIGVANWYAKIQNADGSFPLTPKINTPYTRGTGKIMEVLAIFTDQYADELELAFKYVGRMQYTEDSLYHISLRRKDDFLGGFRHHPFDRDAWIDSAGHILLATARFMRSKKENTTGIPLSN